MAFEDSVRQQEREHGAQLKLVQSTCSTPSSSSSAQSVAIDAVIDHLSCGICAGPVASSLLLSCSHLFCGSCLFTKLQQKPSCPTCNMHLRAVPMRCLAMDKVAASVVPSLTTQQQQQYSKRQQDGQCVADQVNKMFHYLAPPPVFTSSYGVSRVGAVAPSLASACLPAGGQINTIGNTALHPIRTRSRYPEIVPGGTHLQQQLQQCSSAASVPYGSFSTAAATGSAAQDLVQLASAQHLQLMQQQLSESHMSRAAAATAGGALIQCRQTGGNQSALQQSLIRTVGHFNGSWFDRSPLGAGRPAAMVGNDMQLSKILGSMCHV